jgi:amino acid transporter
LPEVSHNANTYQFILTGVDHGLPGSSFLRVLSNNKTPARAVGFVAVCSLLEGLLMLVNTIAINSIFNLAIMGLYFVRLCTDMKFLLSWLLC